MRSRVIIAGLVLVLLSLIGCGGPAPEVTREAPVARVPTSKEGLYVHGQQFWIDRQADSAEVYFLRSAAMDSRASSAEAKARMSYCASRAMEMPSRMDSSSSMRTRENLMSSPTAFPGRGCGW